jgi:hypothetical protein
MRTIAATTALVLALAGLEGCGPAKHPTAPVSGQVTFKGKPLTRGRVIFVHEAGPSAFGDIGPDGRYQLDAPVGPCGVAISCREDPPANLPPEKIQPGVFNTRSLIPERYEDHMNSGFKFTVQRGKTNTADWVLK